MSRRGEAIHANVITSAVQSWENASRFVPRHVCGWIGDMGTARMQRIAAFDQVLKLSCGVFIKCHLNGQTRREVDGRPARFTRATFHILQMRGSSIVQGRAVI